VDKQYRQDLADFAASRQLTLREMRDRLACIALYEMIRLDQRRKPVLVDLVPLAAALGGITFAAATRMAVELVDQERYQNQN